MACELYQDNDGVANNDFYYATDNRSSDQNDNEWIWLSAVGSSSGSGWGRSARIVGNNGCSAQGKGGTGNHNGGLSARFVVRP